MRIVGEEISGFDPGGQVAAERRIITSAIPALSSLINSGERSGCAEAPLHHAHPRTGQGSNRRTDTGVHYLGPALELERFQCSAAQPKNVSITAAQTPRKPHLAAQRLAAARSLPAGSYYAVSPPLAGRS